MRPTVVKPLAHSQMLNKWQRCVYSNPNKPGSLCCLLADPHLKGSDVIAKGGTTDQLCLEWE